MRYFMPASILISQAQSLSLLPSVPLAPPPPTPTNIFHYLPQRVEVLCDSSVEFVRCRDRLRTNA